MYDGHFSIDKQKAGILSTHGSKLLAIHYLTLH